MECPSAGNHHCESASVKVVITNPGGQHAEVHYWRMTLGDRRMDRWRVPAGGEIEVNIPSVESADQKDHVAEQCRILGLSFREGTL